MNLSSRERAFLKKKAHNIEPVVRIGKEGIDEDVLESIMTSIKKRELIKVKVLQNSPVDPDRELGSRIAGETSSIFVDIIGKVMIFFKEDKEKGKLTKELNEFRRKGKRQDNG